MTFLNVQWVSRTYSPPLNSIRPPGLKRRRKPHEEELARLTRELARVMQCRILQKEAFSFPSGQLRLRSSYRSEHVFFTRQDRSRSAFSMNCVCSSIGRTGDKPCQASGLKTLRQHSC
jgi:hypothetical protein